MLHALGDGWRRTLSAWTLVAGVFATTLVAALPIDPQSSLHMWRAELLLQAQNQYVDPAFNVHSGSGVGLYPGAILLWLFLLGGTLDRLARDRPVRTAAFFAACGVYFFRFLRLALPLALLWWFVYRWFWTIVSDDLVTRWPETWRVIVIVAIAAIDVVAHIAAVRMVVEDRRSAIGAWLAALRFVVRRPIRVGGLYLVNWLIGLALFSVWVRLVPPGADASAPAIVAGMALMILRVIARLAWFASEISLFQSSLAHAGYTAIPPAVWPESASVEAIRNLTERQKASP